jgi:periplasmic protein TonB
MELFLKPFYAYDDEGAPADSAKDWQCAVLSFVVHAFFLSIAVFCMPLFARHHDDLPKEEIIMVTMEGLPLGCAMASAGDAGAQFMACDAALQTVPPASPPAPKAPETPKPVKRTMSTVKPKSVNITPPKPETPPGKHPEPEPSPERMTEAAIAPENPPVETRIASGAETSGAGTGSSENGNYSGGGAEFLHGRGVGIGSDTGNGPGTGYGSGETAFGSAGGPRFIHRALPHFPRRAQVQGKEGTVVLRLSIDHEGHLSHVDVVSGAGNGFDEEAVRAIQKSTFSPAVRNGRPVTCLALLSVKFQLESNSTSHSD